jgi:hypothetical protein
MLDQHQKRFVKIVEGLSYGKSNILRDFCEIGAITLANSIQIKDAAWQAREKRYLEVVKAYKPEELGLFAEMLACVVNSLTDGDGFNFHDCLGELHMADEITGRSKWDSDVAFTPKEVALMMARITFSGMKKIPAKGYITVSEPACGGGSMVIAACAVLKEMGYNFQQQLHVTAVELRSMIAHMAYIQFSLLHIPAVVVVHGNSLSLESWSVWQTPAHVLGFWDARLRDFVAPEPQIKQAIQFNKRGQSAFDFHVPARDKKRKTA